MQSSRISSQDVLDIIRQDLPLAPGEEFQRGSVVRQFVGRAQPFAEFGIAVVI